MRQENKVLEIIKTIAVAVLLVMLVCLCILYMLSYQGGQTAEFTRTMMDRLTGESIKYQYLEYFERPYTLPEFIGFSYGRADEKIGFSDEESLRLAYEDVLRFYEKLFSTDGTVAEMTEEEGTAVWRSIMNERYIYIGYSCDLPKSVIVGTALTEMIFSGASGEFIKEIFIVPDRYLKDGFTVGSGGEQIYTSIYSFYAVARDSEGHYYRYTTREAPQTSTDVSFNTNYYFSYNTAESALPYEFAAVLEPDAFLEKYGFSDKIADTTVIYEQSLSGGLLSVSRGTVDPSLEASLLTAFYMNPERVTSFTDEAGVRTYFDEGQSVRFTPDGIIQYTALGEEGIPFEDIFDYSFPLEADIFDYIGASLILADTLSPIENNLMRDLTFFLSGIEYDGTSLRLSFGYRYNGLPVFINGKADILVFEMSEGVIKSVSFSVWDIVPLSAQTDISDFLWLLRGYLTDAQEQRKLVLAYFVTENRGEYGLEIVSVPG